MKTKTIVIIPLAVITSEKLSPTAKVIYAVLKSFQTGKTLPNNHRAVVVTHAEIIKSSNLSKTTVSKAINQLVAAGLIKRKRNEGSANEYIFTGS